MIHSASSRRALRAAILAGTVLSSCCSVSALAQVAGQAVQPPVRQTVDENGVDVARGSFVADLPAVSIGADAKQGLVYQRRTDGNTNQLGSIEVVNGYTVVTIDGASDSFTPSGSGYASTEGNGATLTYVSGLYTYTSRDGVVAVFASNAGYTYSFYEGEIGRLGSITYPDGTKKTYTMRVATYCPGGYEPNGGGTGNVCASPLYYVGRLQSVTNSQGYELKFNYAFTDSATQKISDINYANWGRVTQVTALNLGSEYCDPSAVTCSLSGNWPKLTFSNAAGDQVTDALGRTTSYSPTSVTGPGGTSISAAIDANGRVGSVTANGITTSYSYADAGAVRTTTVTNPLGQSKVFTTDLNLTRITAFRDETNRTTSYAYDSSGRLIRVTMPEGNYVDYTYDARGNAIAENHVAKPGSGLASIATSASYPASCASSVTCNKPTSTTDAKGNVTDYTYNATTGQVTSITLPAATSGGIRPKTTFSYTSNQAYFKNSSGAIAASGQPVSQLTGTSTCLTAASCTGTADEAKTTVSYGPQSAGTANNLLPVGVTKAAGDNSVSASAAAAYDATGNLITVDGPLAGSGDMTRTRYDAARQVVGAVAPDPDGAGSRIPAAVRYSYNNDGQVTQVEQGTVTDQSDTAWNNFAMAAKVVTTYAATRPVKVATMDASTTYTVAQQNYDAIGRPNCSVTRMDPGQWAGQSDACAAQTTGTYGPDRITQPGYDAAGRVLAITTGVGTSIAAVEQTNTYTANGQIASVKDGENNLTSYEYDGHDRLFKTYFPLPTMGAGVSNSSDYDQLTYDANGNITQKRARGGTLVSFGYDNLNRLIASPSANTNPAMGRKYAYNLLGQLTNSSWDDGNSAETKIYNALGQMTQNYTPWDNFTYLYDSGGRRIRTTWGDGFYASYDYDTVGNVTAVRENGAASGVGVLASYTYDSLGRRTGLTRGNGVASYYGYDAIGRMYCQVDDLPGGGAPTCSPSATGNDQALNFVYNPANQIATVTRANDAYAYTGHYNVDRNYVTNGLNQYTSAGSTPFSYGAMGNLSQSGSISYVYNARGQMTRTGVNLAYLLEYGSLDNWQGYNSQGGTYTRFSSDGSNIVSEFVYLNGGTSSRTARHVFVPGSNEPLVSYDSTGARRFLSADERGSVTAVTDSAGAVLAINRYDEYGIPQAGNLGRFQYTGQAWSAELGMYYYKARMYSPTLGRFMQADPIGYGDGLNWYNYVGSDPVNRVDPTGTDYTDAWGNVYTFNCVYVGDSGTCGWGSSGFDADAFRSNFRTGWQDTGRNFEWTFDNFDYGYSPPAALKLGPKPQSDKNPCEGSKSDILDAAETALDYTGSFADAASLGLAGAGALAVEAPPAAAALEGGAAVSQVVSFGAGLTSAGIKAYRGNYGGAVTSLGSSAIGRYGARGLGKLANYFGGNLGGKFAREAQATAASQVANRLQCPKEG